MKMHEKEAMKAYTKELTEWLANMPTVVCPWTMGASILGVACYVDLLEGQPEGDPQLWRLQLREDGEDLVMETLDMGRGDMEFWRAVGRQGTAGTPEVVESVRFAAEG